ncbi:MAG: putative selenate reductase subunit YgfK [Candidatus Riflebacteria bacterium]|nr:putative selenate reductase subunit YgfK [Candidatus Riflebacteria bacterium]
MSKDFSIISIAELFSWIKSEFARRNEIFGIPAEMFFKPLNNHPFKVDRYGIKLETPLGVAAGPHTQMAQNIIAAWLCGARYIELKTVQTLDELNVSKPCIDMQDEGYNCEWSQELRLNDSFTEYLNAWIIIHALKDMLGHETQNGLGCIFNMSVGYNMEGILKENVQRFFAKMANCKDEKDERVESLAKIYPRIKQLSIPNRISDNITLSTMHGCPPYEIEKIGKYLIEEKKLHTTIKLNPTLLGATRLRQILNDQLGFSTFVPDEAFGHDLKYPDALNLIRNLRESAQKTGVHFSLKLTNTLESVNHKNVFLPNEKMMYMSGRALHAISIQVARNIQNDFVGELDTSFCAGVDCFNVNDVLSTGMKPLTVCSDILKPGGYMRFNQYLSEIQKEFTACKASNIDSFILSRAGKGFGTAKEASLHNLNVYADEVLKKDFYQRDFKKGENIKTLRKLEAFDCIKAPCEGTCPVNQEIPQYLYLTAEGKYSDALEVIRRTNPLPNICGMVCDHTCQGKCTRQNYDVPIHIREVKRFLAETEKQTVISKPAALNGKKIAVIGAGPSGLSCAYFLALESFSVTVFETRSMAGGMVSDVIPSFRIPIEAIKRDIELIKQLGVEIKYNQKIGKSEFGEIRKKYDFVFIGVGAQKAKKMGIPGEEHSKCSDFLTFLSKVRGGEKPNLGKRVIVVGGGNSAMDAARCAKRLVEKDGEVQVLYRRTKKEMPADHEEIEALEKEGIKILELSAPAKLSSEGNRAILTCYHMKLSGKDSSGRGKPEKVPGSEFELEADFFISAIGQESIVDFMAPDELNADPITQETRLKGVFIGGDLLRGPSTVIKAISDGKAASKNIMKASENISNKNVQKKKFTFKEYIEKRAKRILPVKIRENFDPMVKHFNLVTSTLTENEAKKESERCLFCDEVCNICTTVCPNRANVYYEIEPGDYETYKATESQNGTKIEKSGTFRISQQYQIINIGDFCNECGNCETFCPTSGSPYKEKPKFYLTEKSFSHEKDGYRIANGVLFQKVNGQLCSISQKNGALEFSNGSVNALLDKNTFQLSKITFKNNEKKSNEIKEFDSLLAVKMAFLLKYLSGAQFVE